MTQQETEEKLSLAVAALVWRRRFYDSNPDVGMGPTLDTMLAELCEEHEVTLSPGQRIFVVAQARRRLGL